MIDAVSAENQLRLVASILSAVEPQNEISEYLKKFEKLLNEDYDSFAGKEISYSDDAGALKKLQKVHSSLKKVAQFPMLFTKNIVAVAGGFSSGKSSFLNTFFRESKVQLSVSASPTTAVPTLIIPGTKSVVTAYTPDGRQGIIPNEIFSRIDHKLIEELNFNLLSIMPYVTVSTPFERSGDLDNICFIDTPGHDAAGEDSANDKLIALESLMSASAVIFTVKITDGEIKQEDINFLNDVLDDDNLKKIYIVCTMADSKPLNQVQDVMREIRETLDNEGIEIEGISATMIKKKDKDSLPVLTEIPFEDEESSVFDFLTELNKVKVNTISRCKELTDQVTEVFSEYKVSIQKDIEKCKNRKQKIKSKTLEFQKFLNEVEQKTDLDVDFDLDFSDLIEDRTALDNENLKICDKIEKEMNSAIRSVFPELKCPSCGAKVENDSPFCSKCGSSLLEMDKGSGKRLCPGCGAELDSDSLFCGKCGTRL